MTKPVEFGHPDSPVSFKTAYHRTCYVYADGAVEVGSERLFPSDFDKIMEILWSFESSARAARIRSGEGYGHAD